MCCGLSLSGPGAEPGLKARMLASIVVVDTEIGYGDRVNPRRACARVTVLPVCVSVHRYLTLGAHARGLQYSFCLCVCLSVCLCVCVCVFPILAPRAIRRTNSSISDFSTIRA